jgi:hypothetical protein
MTIFNRSTAINSSKPEHKMTGKLLVSEEEIHNA